MIRAFLLGVILLLQAAPAFAQSTEMTGAFRARAESLVPILKSEGGEEKFFGPAFLAQIPATQIRSIAQQLTTQNGPVRGVESVKMVDANSGVIEIGYEKAIAQINMTLDPAQPHQVIGLLIAGVRARDDNAAKLSADISALPGKAGFLVQRVDVRSEPPLLSINATQDFAIGSAFKLWILAEAARATSARERHWRDVIALGEPSLPSGIVQKWPRGAPMTLHSLATLMISISDNSATDTLLGALGRDRVGAMVAMTGHANPAATLPILSTRELFALKMDANTDLQAAWAKASQAQRLRLLESNTRRLDIKSINLTQLGGKPRLIDQLEWFAAPADISAALNWLRTSGNAEALAILAVNPGIGPADAARFSYVGYKGGSEPGVISMNILVKTKANAWYTVTASWNNTIAIVDEARFVMLVSRAVGLVR
jgi:beta-lactamase class A